MNKWTAENYLAHSGIMGMKWGRRRYQNSDGSLTPLGREHYGVGPPKGSNGKDEGRKGINRPTGGSEEELAEYFKNNSEELLKQAKNNAYYDRDFVDAIEGLDSPSTRPESYYKSGFKKVHKTLQEDGPEAYKEYEKFLQDPVKYKKTVEQKKKFNKILNNDLLTESDVSKMTKDTNYADRMRAIGGAELGLKALARVGRIDDNELKDKNVKNSLLAWFIYEDQTIGYLTIADLVNRGKSKAEIQKIIEDADSLDYEYKMLPGTFQLTEFRRDPYAEEFLDACIEAKKKKG